MAGAHLSPTTFSESARRHAAWFHELDAWTEYWDIYHPETAGRYYFGNGDTEPGLLRLFLPREHRPPVFQSWVRMALSAESPAVFLSEARVTQVAAAVIEVDQHISRLFATHFGSASDPQVKSDYIDAMIDFGCDQLPPATERARRIPTDDPRKATAGRHALEGDLMWFAWALHLEATQAVVGADQDTPRRALQLAGVAVGCAANFTWRGHRRTRPEYQADGRTLKLLQSRGMAWAEDFVAAANEIHALYQIREWGHEEELQPLRTDGTELTS